MEKRLSEVVPPGALTAHGVYLIKKGELVVKADMRAQGYGPRPNATDVHDYIEKLFELCPEKRDKYEARAAENRAELADPTKAELVKDQEEKLAKVRTETLPSYCALRSFAAAGADAECHALLAQTAAAAAAAGAAAGAGGARQQSLAAGFQTAGARMTKPKPRSGDKGLVTVHKTAENAAPRAAQAPQAPAARAPAAPVAQPAPTQPPFGGVAVLFPPPATFKRPAPDAAAASGANKKQRTEAQGEAARVEPAAAAPQVAAPPLDALPVPSAPAAAPANATQESAGSDPHRAHDAPTLPAQGAGSAAGSQQAPPATSNVQACAAARAAAVQDYADASRALEAKKTALDAARAAEASAAEAARVAAAAAAAARERAAAAARDIVAAEADKALAETAVTQRRAAMHAALEAEAEAMAVAAANSAASP